MRLCAVLGVRFSREEVELVQDAIDRAGEAGTPVDVGVGLRAHAGKIAEKSPSREPFSGRTWFSASICPSRIG